MPLGPTELLIIAGVLVLLFGATKLPKLARSLGESARIFKAETKGIREDEKDEAEGDKSGKAATETAADTRQLPESKPQQEPLVAETVEEPETDRKQAS